MLIVSLAWRDLVRDRFFLFCNTAVMVGILVPLLVLFGVKNGVYAALIGDMLADPANLQIDTAGNGTFGPDDVVSLRDWPEVAFVTPKTRSQFDFLNVRAKGGRVMKAAVLVPSGAGDPTLPEGLSLAESEVAVSAQLAAQLELSEGTVLQLISQAEGRPRQLLMQARVVHVLSADAVAGRAVLARFEMLDVLEAFYDSYDLPDYGITGQRPLSDRVPSYAGIRLYAHRLEDLAPLQARLEAHLNVNTNARTRDVEALLGLGRKLNLALTLTAVLAALGLSAALVLGFWSEVARKKVVLAGISLLGVPGNRLALFPMVQALITAILGLSLSFVLYKAAGPVAARLFGQGLPDGAALTLISLPQGLAICGGVLVLVLLAAGLAAWNVQKLDPASVLREGA
jgi:putative ABC transport system permease protein